MLSVQRSPMLLLLSETGVLLIDILFLKFLLIFWFRFSFGFYGFTSSDKNNVLIEMYHPCHMTISEGKITFLKLFIASAILCAFVSLMSWLLHCLIYFTSIVAHFVFSHLLCGMSHLFICTVAYVASLSFVANACRPSPET